MRQAVRVAPALAQQLGAGALLFRALPTFRARGRRVSCRHLVLVLGDQLDRDSAALDDFEAARDRILMIEARAESTRVPSHKARTVLFLSIMEMPIPSLRGFGAAPG